MKKIFALIIALAFAAPAFVQAQGCMEASSEDGVSVVGYIQPQYTYDQANGAYTSNFHFNRARIGVVGNIPYDFKYYVMTELSPTKNGPYLLDAFITWTRFAPFANLTVGQFKQPFGLELSTPCQSLHTIDRSLVVNELASPFRDLGLMLYGGYSFGERDFNIIDWKIAFTNGKGMNQVDNNRFKDITARLVISPLDFIHIGGSFKKGKVLGNGIDNDLMRYGADISIEAFNFTVQGEYIAGQDDGFKLEGGGCGEDPTIVPADGTFKKSGFFAMVLYDTPWNFQPVVKYQSYDPDTDVDENMKNSYTFGFNYFFNDWTRLQFNYVMNDFAGVDKPNDIVQVQMQVKF